MSETQMKRKSAIESRLDRKCEAKRVSGSEPSIYPLFLLYDKITIALSEHVQHIFTNSINKVNS